MPNNVRLARSNGQPPECARMKKYRRFLRIPDNIPVRIQTAFRPIQHAFNHA
jgi:hypothetical protein